MSTIKMLPALHVTSLFPHIMCGSQDAYGFTVMSTIKVLPALHVTSLFPQQVTDYNMAKSLQSFAQNGPTHQVINSSLTTVIFYHRIAVIII